MKTSDSFWFHKTWHFSFCIHKASYTHWHISGFAFTKCLTHTSLCTRNYSTHSHFAIINHLTHSIWQMQLQKLVCLNSFVIADKYQRFCEYKIWYVSRGFVNANPVKCQMIYDCKMGMCTIISCAKTGMCHKKCRSSKNSEGPAENSWVLDLCPAKWKQISKDLNCIRSFEDFGLIFVLRRNASGTTTFLWLTHCYVARTVNKILNRNGFGEGNDTNQGGHVFLFYYFFGGFSLEKIILRITIYSNIFKHGNVSIIKMWSFLKHYDRAQLGKLEIERV
jgi:hypothetical protein